MSKIGEHVTTWFCNTCHPTEAPEMTGAQCKEHLREVHKLKDLKGNRRLVMALDGDFYQNTFEVEIGGVKLTQISSGPK